MLQEAVDTYITSLSFRREGESGSTNRNTLVAYRNDLHQLCSYLELERHIENWAQVTGENVVEYLREMREGLGYRPTTIARKLAALKSFFRYMCMAKNLAHNPVEHLESPKVQKDLPQALSIDQIRSLFCQVEGDTPTGQRDLAMLQLLYATGMRVTELVSLNLRDYDIERATVICPGRNDRNRRERVLRLPAHGVEVLQCYLRIARPRLVLRHPGEPALFLNHHGERLTRQGFWLIVKGYARQAGIEEITPQMLRHSFALLMLSEGKELRCVQELLGHAHLSTTQVYSQLARTRSTLPT